MQSGISASAELQKAFASFAADSSLFALPVTITSEALTPLPTIPFPNPSSTFISSLSSLDSLLEPNVPLYLLLRKSPSSSNLIATTYIPSRAPVRQKTLFASTRATLIRELGSEKFVDTVFLTEREEVLDPKTWADSTAGNASAGGAGGGVDNTALLSVEERELQAVKRAEEEERHGTRGHDLMNEGGSGGSGGTIGARDGSGAGRSGVTMNISDEARQGFVVVKEAQNQGGSGALVQFGIDIPNESITLLKQETSISPADVYKHLPTDHPSYSFYAPSGSNAQGVLFIYVCPGTSKIKERMLYASSRRAFLKFAGDEGITVKKRLEAGEPDDLDGQRIPEEVAALAEGEDNGSAPGSGTATPRGATGQGTGGFARPKRPGRR